MRPTKFNFISPEDEVMPSNINMVSIAKNGILTFFASYIQNCQLEGQFISFFVDPDRGELGWVLAKSLDSFKGMKCSQYRPLKVNSNHVMNLSVKRILAKLNVTITGKPLKLEVEEYYDYMLSMINHVALPVKKVNLYKLQKEEDADKVAQMVAGVGEELENE
jgi:hypothetical protein